MDTKKATISLIIATALGILIAIAGAHNGQTINHIPILVLCVAGVFILNWLAFIPAYRFQTEKFFDIIGSLSYLSVICLGCALSQPIDGRTILLAVLVTIWAVRLGTFLFRRIHRSGKDDRFDAIKPNIVRFLNAWTLQALWVVLTASPAFIAITAAKRESIGWLTYVGLTIWLIGFGIEVVADYQKTQFRKQPKNKDRFIQTGLWSRSRHPNYFGEIVLWIGISLIAIPVLQGWQWIALISPVFVTLLLTRVSGVPMLEAKADKQWGGQEAYEAYKASTPTLIPKL
ncbi:MAG: DUF1295 domain-containing protein [Bacteroidota bacterium]